jgi:hypothetical protein
MKIKAGLSILIVLCAGNCWSAVTPVNSSLALHAAANAGVNPVTDDHSQSQTTTLNNLSVSVFAQAFNGTKKDSSGSSATASWLSANSGQFTFDTKFNSDDLTAYSGSELGSSGNGLSYTFTSDLAATLTLNYNISRMGSYTYALLPAYSITRPNVPDIADYFSPQGPASGSMSFAIAPGSTCTFGLFDISNLHQNLPAFSSEMIATFSYTITEVPESGTGLALFAFAVVVGRICRGRRASVCDRP